MCGVLGFVSQKDRKDMGILASKLLQMLEYRGYDSTGAVIQDEKGNITLRKAVGAPSVVTHELGIPELTGRLFCGQVRWATFGTVTHANAQPHVVNCHVHIYGAHNGNVTNCDQLKKWLIQHGHDVKSDNDGEMVVHMIEHHFARELIGIPTTDLERRVLAFKKAIEAAATHLIGSFAAVVVDPLTKTSACIKAGSSLYMGMGHCDEYGAFIVVSSDLSAVLSQTRILIPLKENEFVIYTADEYTIYNLKTGEKQYRRPMRSHLKVEETELKAPYKYFMEQEIYAQVDAGRKLIDLFTGSSDVLAVVEKIHQTDPDLIKDVKHWVISLSEITSFVTLKERTKLLFESEAMIAVSRLADIHREHLTTPLESSFTTLLTELAEFIDQTENTSAMIRLIDGFFLQEETSDINTRITHFVDMMVNAWEYGSSIYLLACGTSFHAAKTATLYFNRIAGLNLFPLLPGEFRSQHENSLRDRDVVIGISQSGETKDLIDIFNLVRKSDKDIKCISIVNNTNSSLALEKSELFIPLFCGPEIAVPATKSFFNQLVVLYILALRVAERFSRLGLKKIDTTQLQIFQDNLHKIPDLVRETIDSTEKSIDEIVNSLYLEPSMHILATGMLGIAKEGALKIREVVLNHTEGFEGSEFKHGPNTILGINTIFGLPAIRQVMMECSELIKTMNDDETIKDSSASFHEMVEATFKHNSETGTTTVGDVVGTDIFSQLYSNYPLLFVTNSTERDVHLTISQINTHKIRGANVYIIAEENSYLRDALENIPDTVHKDRYKTGYIVLPKTEDSLLPTFTSTIVLQLLALRMSVKKMRLLDSIRFLNHGVHPDSPKNVSKSITVD